MILTNKQEEALKIAVQRYRAGAPYTVISGYAGSGKSTVVRFIIEALGVPLEEVAYVAFTGKAAKVLAQKGCPNATTAHKLLYWAKQMPNGKYNFTEKPVLEEGYRVIVVDEVSMLPTAMWNLLLSHRVYVLACGDPGQLPPISAKDNNHVLDNPHVFLDEIMRQAKESEIIRLSMHVREGKPLSTFEQKGEQVKIITQDELLSGHFTWADQILCATNERRNQLNHLLRELKGFGPEPQIGDKVISLKNHWDDFSTAGNPLTNGTIGYITDYYTDSGFLPFPVNGSNIIKLANIAIDTEDNDAFNDLIVDYNALAKGEKTLDGHQEFLLTKKKITPPYEFVYGYAITTWKAQGSEWDKVLGFEEHFPWETDLHQRFLYTMITRASQKLVIVRK